MTHLRFAFVLAALTIPFAAFADRDGHEHWRHGGKQEYWEGNCKVERKWDKHGEYKEKRKCVGPVAAPAYVPAPAYVQPAPVVVRPAPVYVQPAPVYVQPAPVYVQPAPAVVVEPGLTIQGTIRLK